MGRTSSPGCPAVSPRAGPMIRQSVLVISCLWCVLSAQGGAAQTAQPNAAASGDTTTASAIAAKPVTAKKPVKTKKPATSKSGTSSRYKPDRFAGRAGTYYRMVWGVDSLGVKTVESGEII